MYIHFFISLCFHATYCSCVLSMPLLIAIDYVLLVFIMLHKSFLFAIG